MKSLRWSSDKTPRTPKIRDSRGFYRHFVLKEEGSVKESCKCAVFEGLVTIFRENNANCFIWSEEMI